MEQKPRVWPGQDALQRSTIATYFTLGAERLAQNEFRLFVSQLPLTWPSQGRESVVIYTHHSKLRKNQKTTARHYGKNFCSTHFIVDKVLHFIV